ncbi:MAG TPA: heme biosynthesis HemY N-terminal domain-containing protein [Woeseiaceae bacterium]|nr:heme biosynthesis HemY N-terminal domain-containing protein [Woeseiaceae bacterium]
MKFGFVVVIALLASAFAAHFLLQDPGYVVINFRGYIIEMSVPVLVGIVLSLMFLLWMLVKIWNAPRKLGEAASRYRSGKAGERLTRGMIEIAEGNFSRGEKMLARSASASDAPLLNYLQAARAAHLLGEDDRRDKWLKQAYEQTPEAANAVLLTQAELQLDQGQYEQALATLRKLDENAPNHSHALALLGRLYYRLEDWPQLAELLPRLAKHGRLDAHTLEKWSVRVHRELMAKAADYASLDEAWKKVPRNLRNNLALLEAWYAGLIRTEQHDVAEKDLAAELKHEWRTPLVRLYGLVRATDPVRQLKRAEGWLKQHPDDAELLLAAARLCLRNELWGKARSYLDTVVSIRPTPEVYQEFGRLLNQLGDGEGAANAYRAGLSLAAGSDLPAIPHLAATGSGSKPATS